MRSDLLNKYCECVFRISSLISPSQKEDKKTGIKFCRHFLYRYMPKYMYVYVYISKTYIYALRHTYTHTHLSIHLSIYLSIYLFIYLSIYLFICLSIDRSIYHLSICICTTVTNPTFMVGGVPGRDKMTNSRKLGHSEILKMQRIYFRVKDGIFFPRASIFILGNVEIITYAFSCSLGRGWLKKNFWWYRWM